MKRLIFNITLMLVAMMGVSLTSCDTNSNRLTAFYNITLSDDMAQVADLAITYKGDGGATVTDTITSTVWEKKIHLDSFPSQFGLVDYTFIPKPAGKLKKETYELEAEFTIFTREEKLQLNHNFVNTFTVKRDKVAPFLDLINEHDDVSIFITATKEKDGFKFSGKSKMDVYFTLENLPQVHILDKEENDSTVEVPTNQ